MAFKEEAGRLLREDWQARGVQGAMEEIYAILQGWDEKGLTGPVTINSKGSQPAIRDIRSLPVSGVSDIRSLPVTAPVISSIGPTGASADWLSDGTSQKTAAPQPAKGGPAVQPKPQPIPAGAQLGRIVSGTGSTYQVQLLSTSEIVQATHPQIVSTDTIPVGRYVAVYVVSNLTSILYYLLEPTWIDPA